MTDADFLLMGFRQMIQSDLQGGTLTYSGGEIDCTVGTFQTEDVLVAGGVSKMLLGDVQIARDDLTVGYEFLLGENITITPNRGPARECQFHSSKDMGVILSLTLQDPNQTA